MILDSEVISLNHPVESWQRRSWEQMNAACWASRANSKTRATAWAKSPSQNCQWSQMVGRDHNYGNFRQTCWDLCWFHLVIEPQTWGKKNKTISTHGDVFRKIQSSESEILLSSPAVCGHPCGLTKRMMIMTTMMMNMAWTCMDHITRGIQRVTASPMICSS